MIKGNAGKLAWMESFNNPQSNNVDAFDVASLDGDMPNDLLEQQSMMFQEVLEEAA